VRERHGGALVGDRCTKGTVRYGKDTGSRRFNAGSSGLSMPEYEVGG